MSTNLELSLFLRLDEGRIKIKNASISAILFVSVGATHSQVCGALNPEPKHRLKTELLYEIPFVYLNDWPVERNKVRLAWTMGNRRQYAIPHASIRKD